MSDTMTDHLDLHGLGHFLRSRRQAQQLTQSQLGALLGWTQERISLLETGKYGMPSVQALAHLTEALACPLVDLLEAAGLERSVLGIPRTETDSSRWDDAGPQ